MDDDDLYSQLFGESAPPEPPRPPKAVPAEVVKAPLAPGSAPQASVAATEEPEQGQEEQAEASDEDFEVQLQEQIAPAAPEEDEDFEIALDPERQQAAGTLDVPRASGLDAASGALVLHTQDSAHPKTEAAQPAAAVSSPLSNPSHLSLKAFLLPLAAKPEVPAAAGPQARPLPPGRSTSVPQPAAPVQPVQPAVPGAHFIPDHAPPDGLGAAVASVRPASIPEAVQQRAAAADQPPALPSQAAPGQPIRLPGQARVDPAEYREFLMLGHGGVYELDVDSYAADFRDFFNYDMDMRGWKEYCRQVHLARMQAAMQRKIQTYSTPQAVSATADEDLPPELAEALRAEQGAALHASSLQMLAGPGASTPPRIQGPQHQPPLALEHQPHRPFRPTQPSTGAAVAAVRAAAAQQASSAMPSVPQLTRPGGFAGPQTSQASPSRLPIPGQHPGQHRGSAPMPRTQSPMHGHSSIPQPSSQMGASTSHPSHSHEAKPLAPQPTPSASGQLPAQEASQLDRAADQALADLSADVKAEVKAEPVDAAMDPAFAGFTEDFEEDEPADSKRARHH